MYLFLNQTFCRRSSQNDLQIFFFYNNNKNKNKHNKVSSNIAMYELTISNLLLHYLHEYNI